MELALHDYMRIVRGSFLVSKISNFFAAGRDSAPIDRFSPKGLEEGAEQSIPGGDNKQD